MDIPFILSRIRPGAAWGWSGDDYSNPAQLVWRDLVQIVPTQQELDDEDSAIQAEQATIESVRGALKSEYAPLAGSPISALTNTQLKLLVEILCYIMGGIDEETRVLLPASAWKQAKEILKA